MTLEELREAYQFETSRKYQIESSVGFLVGILLALASVLGTMISKFQHHSDTLSWIFLFFSILTIVALGITFRNVIRVYYNKYNVHYLPNWGDVSKYERELKAFHEQNKSPAGQAEKEFREFLHDAYINVIDNNSWNNDSKVVYLHNARSSLIWAAILIVLSGAPYIINEKTASPSISKVEITNTKINVVNEHESDYANPVQE